MDYNNYALENELEHEPVAIVLRSNGNDEITEPKKEHDELTEKQKAIKAEQEAEWIKHKRGVDKDLQIGIDYAKPGSDYADKILYQNGEVKQAKRINQPHQFKVGDWVEVLSWEMFEKMAFEKDDEGYVHIKVDNERIDNDFTVHRGGGGSFCGNRYTIIELDSETLNGLYLLSNGRCYPDILLTSCDPPNVQEKESVSAQISKMKSKYCSTCQVVFATNSDTCDICGNEFDKEESARPVQVAEVEKKPVFVGKGEYDPWTIRDILIDCNSRGMNVLEMAKEIIDYIHDVNNGSK